jgi:hypothetical protein
MKKLIKVSLFTILLFTTPVKAQLIQWDAFYSGDSLAVKDSESGLVWLDLSLTSGMSFNQAGNAFSGWGYAQAKDVWRLIDTAFSDIQLVRHGTNEVLNYEQNCPNSSSCYVQAQRWQVLFGAVTSDWYYQTYAFGLYEDDTSRLKMAGSYVNGTVKANLYGKAFDGVYNSDVTNSLYSTFLVKQPLVNLLVEQPSVAAPVKVTAPSDRAILFLPLLWLVRRRVKPTN